MRVLTFTAHVKKLCNSYVVKLHSKICAECLYIRRINYIRLYLRLCRAEEDAEDFFAGALHAGDTFGEEALFFRLAHPFTVQCTTLCRLISLSAEAWSDLEEQLPKEVQAVQLECYFRMRVR